MEIGSRLSLALSSEEMSMVELAELERIKNKNLMGGLLSRVLGKIPTLGVELKALIPADSEASLKRYQESNSDTSVWLETI